MLWYFMVLGLGFMFIEIVFIQKFVLLLPYPVIAVAAVLAGFLVLAGIGSALAGRWHERFGARRIARVAIVATAILAPT